MSFKPDDRSRTKRNNMRTFKKQHYRNISHKENSLSQRLPVEQPIRTLIDIADSSDDRVSVISNNAWSAINSDEEVNEQMNAADFDTLQKMPVSGNYTTFSHEKNWDIESDKQDSDKVNSDKISYFTLNRNLINAGLETIPFYKRMDYPNGMFEKSEIKRWNLQAELAETKFQAILNGYEQKENSKPNSGNSKKSNVTESKGKIPSDVKEDKELITQKTGNEETDAELNELLSMTETAVEKLNLETSNEKQIENADEPKNSEEIQQWLDQVLE